MEDLFFATPHFGDNIKGKRPREYHPGTNLLHAAFFPGRMLFKMLAGKVTDQGRKRNPNPNCLVRISSGGVGVFHVKGWGPKSSVCPSKPRETKLFGGTSRDFARDIPGAPEKFEVP